MRMQATHKSKQLKNIFATAFHQYPHFQPPLATLFKAAIITLLNVLAEHTPKRTGSRECAFQSTPLKGTSPPPTPSPLRQRESAKAHQTSQPAG